MCSNGVSVEEGVRPLVGCWEKIHLIFLNIVHYRIFVNLLNLELPPSFLTALICDLCRQSSLHWFYSNVYNSMLIRNSFYWLPGSYF